MFGFSSIGPFELLLILVVALAIFGPKKLPEIGRAIGQAIRSFREQSQKLAEELTLDVPDQSSRVRAAEQPPQPAQPAEPRRPRRRRVAAPARKRRKSPQ